MGVASQIASQRTAPRPRASTQDSQVLNEPASIVTESGRTVATLGEGEQLKIKPSAKPASRHKYVPGVPAYAAGGTVTVQNLASQPKGTVYTASGVTSISGGDGKTYSPGNFKKAFGYDPVATAAPATQPANTVLTPRGAVSTLPQQTAAPAPSTGTLTPVTTSTSSGGAAGQAIYNAEGAVLDARQADINANRGVTAAQQAEINAGRAYINAQGKVLDAQGNELNAQGRVIAAQRTELAASRNALSGSQAYLDEQQAATAASRAEEEQIQAAAGNIADKSAVARAQNERNNTDYLFGVAGLTTPVEYDEPTGGATNAAAPGTRASLRTQEQLVTEKATNARNLRGYDLDASQQAAQEANLAAQAAGLDVSGARLDLADAGLTTSRAQINASRANLGVQSASLNTSSARNAAAASGLDVSQAGLNLDIAQRPPAPGMVFDSESGNFVSEAQFRVLQAQRGIEYDEINKTFVPRQELLDRTDAAGNVLRLSDNVWVDPRTGNELINGTWTDPKTGNVLQAQEGGRDVWLNPATGNKFYVENPNTGAGYWQNPDGYVLQGDGQWVHPVTGARIIDGVIYTYQQLQDARGTGSGGGSGSIVWNPDTGQFELAGGATGASAPTTAPGATAGNGGSAPASSTPPAAAPVFTNPITGSETPYRPPTFR